MKGTKEDRTITTKEDIKTTVVDNAEHRTGSDSLYAPQNPWSVEIARREDTTKRCAVFPKIQHVDRPGSLAEEDNWDYDKIQKKSYYIYVTLLVNNPPIKFIIYSGFPVTLILQRLFNKTTKVEKMNTDYKDVNDNKIDFVGQTNATVKTNTTSLKLPLLITKAIITPLL